MVIDYLNIRDRLIELHSNGKKLTDRQRWIVSKLYEWNGNEISKVINI